MASNIELQDYLTKHKKALPISSHFIGCYSANRLPKNVNPGDCLIVNYSPDNKNGTHWVAMSGLKTNNVMYFDSYGLHPDEADKLLRVSRNII